MPKIKLLNNVHHNGEALECGREIDTDEHGISDTQLEALLQWSAVEVIQPENAEIEVDAAAITKKTVPEKAAVKASASANAQTGAE